MNFSLFISRRFYSFVRAPLFAKRQQWWSDESQTIDTTQIRDFDPIIINIYAKPLESVMLQCAIALINRRRRTAQ